MSIKSTTISPVKICIGVLFAFFLNLFMLQAARAVVVDIMIVYDTTASNWVASNGGKAAFSADAVNRMNQALQNSGLNHSFRLVHSMSVNYTKSGSFSTDLGALQNGSGAFQAVHTARDDYGADLVAMMIDTGSAVNIVGAGYTLSSWSGNSNYGFTVNAIRSVDISHTLTHEVGHNLGAHHAKNQDSQPGPNVSLDNQYSAGWYFTGTNGTTYHTIMAYNFIGSVIYPSAPLFSTPSKTYQGTAAGQANNADNTRLISQTIATIAGYRNAPTTVTLTGLTINGSSNVDENSSEPYSATASWSNGSTTTANPNWSVNSSYATINQSGDLTTSSVSSDQSITINASYTANGVTKSDNHSVTVKNVPPALTGLTISGETNVNENSSETYSAKASWSDGSTTFVNASWSENSPFTTINSSGALTASSVSSDQNITINASYTANGVTKSDNHSVTIKNITATLISLAINGPISVDETNSESYSAEAHWSDGNITNVNPSWDEDSTYTEINSSGLLTASSVPSDQAMTVSASYTVNGVTKSDTHSVTVKNITATLTNLTINGPTYMNENSSVIFSATANWSDGSITEINPDWSENSLYTTINPTGVLTASTVSSHQTATISVSYTVNGVTKSDTQTIYIVDLETDDGSHFPWLLFRHITQ